MPKAKVSAPSLVAEMTDSIQDKSNCSNDNCGMKLVLGVWHGLKLMWCCIHAIRPKFVKMSKHQWKWNIVKKHSRNHPYITNEKSRKCCKRHDRCEKYRWQYKDNMHLWWSYQLLMQACNPKVVQECLWKQHKTRILTEANQTLQQCQYPFWR